jgi:hypothetical protein
MPGKERQGSRAGRRAALVLAVALTVAAAPAIANAAAQSVVAAKSRTVSLAPTDPGAIASKKGKKKRAPARTVSASAPLSPGGLQTATANCPGGTHVSGGGWSVSPPFTPNGLDTAPGGTGTRITHLQSQSSGNVSWTAGAAAFATPAVAGTFTSIARCESNSLGKTVGGVFGTTTVPVSQGTTVNLNCSPGTHVVTGGFSLSPAGNLAVFDAFRPVVVASRRFDVDTWQVHVVNPTGSPSVATLFSNVVCERNARGVSVTEALSVVPVINNARTSATATCTGKTHVVGGGFLLSPLTGPAVGIDQMQPVGGKAWQVGLYEYPNFALPAGSSLAAYSYCKKDSLPRKK